MPPSIARRDPRYLIQLRKNSSCRFQVVVPRLCLRDGAQELRGFGTWVGGLERVKGRGLDVDGDAGADAEWEETLDESRRDLGGYRVVRHACRSCSQLYEQRETKRTLRISATEGSKRRPR